MQNQAAKEDPIAVRQWLLDRVISDFTFKADQTDDQKHLWGAIDTKLMQFRSAILSLFENSDKVLQSEQYESYMIALRETERWLNTAVANDFEGISNFDNFDIEQIKYPGPQNSENERIQLCEETSKLCFGLITDLVRIVPPGRALSVAITRMQDVRGWLLDAINFNMPRL